MESHSANATNQKTDICMTAVKHHWSALKYVKNQTPEICKEALKQDLRAIEYVKDQTPEMCLETVKRNWQMIQYIKNQTPEICIEAVKHHGMALSFVKDPTPEVCMEAVKQDCRALQYVENQTVEICVAAAKRNEDAFLFVNEELLPDVKFGLNVSHALDKICEYTGKDVYTMECGNAIIVCEDGTETPIATLDENGDLEYFVNGWEELRDGQEQSLGHDALDISDAAEDRDDL